MDCLPEPAHVGVSGYGISDQRGVSMKRLIVALPAALMGLTSVAVAQEAPVETAGPVMAVPASVPAAAPAPPAAPVEIVLPANAELVVTPSAIVSSKEKKEGDTFDFTTVTDLAAGGYIVIPKGTRGQGTITWRTGKGAAGKSAKMDLGFDWIEIGDRRIKLTGTHRQEGAGNTAATLGTVALFGPFAGLVTGKSAIVPLGAQLKAYIAEPTAFDPEGLPKAPEPTETLPASPAETPVP